MKREALFVVLLIMLCGITNRIQGQTINVCYNASSEFTLPSFSSEWTYTWEKKNTSESTWNTIGSGTSVTVNSIIQDIDVRCLVDTNANGV